ncbi:hypothetical protein SAMN06298216_4119 [Spirosomataceae bacterium TFI 002]|nr:hypothetical protein SAMN06298216_4119 [Spirosomataceae bacterium TFI 002]
MSTIEVLFKYLEFFPEEYPLKDVTMFKVATAKDYRVYIMHESVSDCGIFVVYGKVSTRGFGSICYPFEEHKEIKSWFAVKTLSDLIFQLGILEEVLRLEHDLDTSELKIRLRELV